MAGGLAPAGSAAAQFLIVQEIAGDVDGSHRPGFARQPTEIRIVLVALRAAMGIVRLPQEIAGYDEPVWSPEPRRQYCSGRPRVAV